MISISSALPAVTARAGSAVSARSIGGKGGKGKGIKTASLFQAAANNAFASLLGKTPAQPATANADPIAQLRSLLQNGTPMATIVDRISQSVGSSAAKLLTGKYSSGDLDRLRSTITKTIANALSPPSNAPPGTAAKQAAALAARLQKLVESLARDAQNGLGQQSEFSGNLLDANSAKELPAQQKTTGTSSALDASAVARSVLASVVAALSAPAGAGSTSAAASPLHAPSGAAATTAALAQIATQTTSTTDAQTGAPSSSGLPAQSNASAVLTSQTTSISMSNAPDLLARMLVRAAGADAQINGSYVAASDAGSAGTSSLSPSDIAARFAAILSEASGTGAISGSSSGNAGAGGNAGHAFDGDPAQATSSNVASLATPPAAQSLFSQVQNALQSGQGQSAPVDVSSVIEQMVSSMAMRTAQQGTSEIRLQLQPENLGQVTMRLTVSGSQVNASVVAQSADVRTALVANHQELARSLSEAGLTLSGFSVDVSGGDAGNDQSKDRTAGFGRRFTVHELANGDASSQTAESSSLGPQILGDSKLALFNYLA